MTDLDGPLAVLAVTDLHAGYIDSKILHGVTIQLEAGRLVTVIGPNGSGKSTLLKAIYGLINVTHGSVKFTYAGAPTELRGREPYWITSIGINYMPQRANVFESMSVQENLEIGLMGRGGVRLAPADRRLAYDRMLDWFPMLGDRLKQQAGTLSGGQRQMVALARSLVSQPRLLLLDEPSAALAPNVVDEIFEKILEIKDRGVSILLVEQNARRALAIADYAYVLESGRNRYEGSGSVLLHDPNVIRLYLGGMARTSPRPSHAESS